VTVGTFPCYLIRVPEKVKNGGFVGAKLGEKGNRVPRKGTTRASGQDKNQRARCIVPLQTAAGLARDISWYDKGA
jgi:hypothetical protein